MKTIKDMAHDYMCSAILKGFPLDEIDTMAERCFKLAEAMQAEAEKRKATPNADPMRKVREAEWQPDWSQAPDSEVQYFAVDENGCGGWFISKPILCSDHWYWSDFEERVGNDCYDHAPSFNYQGDWKDSLRKRP